MKRSFDSKTRKQVVVIGGGTAGFPAAVVAARNDADTLLVERSQCLGGMMTEGLVLALSGMRIHTDTDTTNAYQEYEEAGDRSRQLVRGICQEIYDRIIKVNGAHGREGEATNRVPFDGEAVKLLADQMVEEAGVEVWLQSMVTDVVMDNQNLKGIVVQNKSGKHLVEADVFIDASGDADVAYLAGVPYSKGRNEDGKCMAMTLAFIMGNVDIEKIIEYLKQNPEQLRGGEIERREKLYQEKKPVSFRGFEERLYEAYQKGDLPLAIGAENPIPLFAIDPIIRMGTGLVQTETLHIVDMAYGLDGTDAKDLTKAFMGTRKRVMVMVNFLKKYIPGFERSYLLQMATQLGIRETRRIVGEYVLTKEDILEAKAFEDKIARGGRGMNVHSSAGGKKGEPMGGQHWTRSVDPWEIPYRCLLPLRVEGLLVAGRCISVDHNSLGSVRGEPICIATGEAAGTAAAIAVKERVGPRELSAEKLQGILINQGVDLGQRLKT